MALTYNNRIMTSGYDTDAQNWFNQLTIQPSTQYKTYMNSLIVNLKTAGIWNLLDVMWVFATEQQQHARIDIKSLSALTETPNGGTLTWTQDQGYKSDGTHSYLNTNVSLSALTNYSLNSASFFIYSRTNLAQSNILDHGTRDSINGNWANLNIRNAGNLFNGFVNNPSSTSIIEVNVSTSLGGFGEVRTSSTTGNLYQNGVSLTATTTGFLSSAIPGASLYICGMNNNGVAGNFTTRQYSCFAVGSGAINQSLLYTIFQNFAVDLGFNV